MGILLVARSDADPLQRVCPLSHSCPSMQDHLSRTFTSPAPKRRCFCTFAESRYPAPHSGLQRSRIRSLPAGRCSPAPGRRHVCPPAHSIPCFAQTVGKRAETVLRPVFQFLPVPLTSDHSCPHLREHTMPPRTPEYARTLLCSGKSGQESIRPHRNSLHRSQNRDRARRQPYRLLPTTLAHLLPAWATWAKVPLHPPGPGSG